jgi:serine/alanine racemase
MSSNRSDVKRLKYPAVDFVKFILAISVLFIHFQPLRDFSQMAHHLSADTLARLAVPFFFMSTGFLSQDALMEASLLKRRLVKIFKLWLIWSLIYLPYRLIGMAFNQLSLTEDLIILFKDIVLQGVFIHLWYLPAVMFSLIALYLLLKKMSIQSILFVSFILFVIGSFADAYTGLFQQSPTIYGYIEFYLDFFITSRNGLFFGLFFVALGYYIQVSKVHHRFKSSHLFGWFILSLFILFGELLVLLSISQPFDFNMRLGLIPSVVLLFMWSLQTPFVPEWEESWEHDVKIPLFQNKDATWYRLMSSMIYFSHFFIHFILMAFLSYFNLSFLIGHSLTRFTLTLIATLWFSQFVIKRAQAKDGWARKLIRTS